MSAEEIISIIRDELSKETDLSDLNGYDLSNWTYVPSLEKYRNRTRGDLIGYFWTVFEERPDGKGYYIYYDENTRLFGLALNDQDNTKIKIGDYGPFVATLWAM